jgi:hypothetical protein
MPVSHVEYLGFRIGETTRDYRLLIRHPDGVCQQFVLAIPHEAFTSQRVRYQDAAEICFLKLSRALDQWISAPGSPPLAASQDVTDADLLAYREAHTSKPPQRRPPRPPAA